MEKRKHKKTKLTVLIAILSMFPSIMVSAQSTDHYRERYLQFRSMEIEGEWNFHPGFYYVVTHKRYSGGRGFFKPKFDVSKSNVGHISPKRKAEIALESTALSHINEDIERAEPIAFEETIRAAERQADEVYLIYSPVFKKLNECITSCLNAEEIIKQPVFLQRSLKMKEEQDMLNDEIKFMHGMGPSAQCEQARREIAYSEIKERLEKLSTKSYNMLLNAKAQAKLLKK